MRGLDKWRIFEETRAPRRLALQKSVAPSESDRRIRMQIRCPLSSLLALALLPGCGGPSASTSSTAGLKPETPLSSKGVQILQSLSEAVLAAGDRLRPSMLHAELVTAQDQTAQGTALVLTPEGMALLPFNLGDGSQIRILRVWVNGKEANAKLLRSDERLGMSLVQIDKEAGPFRPVPPAAGEALRSGDWVVDLSTTGKEQDFQVMSHLGMVRGTLPGEFQRVLVDASNLPGTLVADLQGHLVGIQRGNNLVLAFPDVRRRLDTTLMKASPAETAAAAEEAKERGQPNFGVTLQPMNEDYAEASGLPKEAVWVLNVFRDSPAEKAGLRPSDLIVKVDDKPLTASGAQALQSLFRLLNMEVGRSVKLQVLRGGERLDLPCRFEKAESPKEFRADDLGIQVREITDAVYYGTPDLFARDGVLVIGTINNSPARPSPNVQKVMGGDVITDLDGQPTPTIKAFLSAVEGVRQRKAAAVLIKFHRGTDDGIDALNMALGDLAKRKKEANHKKGEIK